MLVFHISPAALQVGADKERPVQQLLPASCASWLQSPQNHGQTVHDCAVSALHDPIVRGRGREGSCSERTSAFASVGSAGTFQQSSNSNDQMPGVQSTSEAVQRLPKGLKHGLQQASMVGHMRQHGAALGVAGQHCALAEQAAACHRL